MYISKISAIRNEAQLKFANHKQLLNQSLRLCNEMQATIDALQTEMQELKKAPTKKAPAKKAPAKKAPAKKRASTKK
jgi:hypothetical protein